MISIDRFEELLETLACELPPEFFDELNLGISLSPEEKPHPQSRGNELYIMGEYFRQQMGRGIVIYYGSFSRLHGNMSESELLDELRRTLRHEFRHHMECRAGERGLEIEDEKQLQEYLEQ